MTTFVRLYASDWRSGCIGMTLEQEGFYIRVCAYIYETSQRLSLDDSKAAKFLGMHTNAYRKHRDQLAALGKLVRADDGWTVLRAEKELRAARSAHMVATRRTDGKAQVNRGVAVEADGSAVSDTVGNTPHNTHHETPHETNGVLSKKANEINGPLKSQEPIAKKVVCESEVAQGLFVNGKTIRHASFSISVDGVAMQCQAAGASVDEVKQFCLAHALQWAAEIDGGKRPDQVVPSKIANFLGASFMGSRNRDQIASVRRDKAQAPAAYHGKPEQPRKRTLRDALNDRVAAREAAERAAAQAAGGAA